MHGVCCLAFEFLVVSTRAPPRSAPARRSLLVSRREILSVDASGGALRVAAAWVDRATDPERDPRMRADPTRGLAAPPRLCHRVRPGVPNDAEEPAHHGRPSGRPDLDPGLRLRAHDRTASLPAHRVHERRAACGFGCSRFRRHVPSRVPRQPHVHQRGDPGDDNAPYESRWVGVGSAIVRRCNRRGKVPRRHRALAINLRRMELDNKLSGHPQGRSGGKVQPCILPRVASRELLRSASVTSLSSRGPSE